MSKRWAVIGSGMLGLTMARRLRQAGHEVVLIEAADEIGGLASAWQLGPVVWDRHYHVTLLSDSYTRGMLRELGLDDDMQWVETKTGYYADGVLSSVSNTVEFLKLPSLRMIDKARLGATIFFGSKMKNWRRLEQQPVERWLTKWSGRRTFERFWEPLLRAKLGESYRDASAAFIWATIQRLYAARRSGLKKELFGYLPGGYARVFARFAEVLRADGVELQVGTRVTSIAAVDGGMGVSTADGSTQHFDQVVLTAAAPMAARLCEGLTDDERTRLAGTRYQGIVCASLLLDQPLSDYYLTYVIDAVPFTAVVEMSAFVDRAQFDGHTLVYLPKYVAPDDPLFEVSDDEIAARFLPALEKMYPHFRRDHIRAFQVSRVRNVFAVPTLNYSLHEPPVRTSISGLHLVSSANIVNGTLNVNETVELAERAASQLTATATPVHTGAMRQGARR